MRAFKWLIILLLFPLVAGCTLKVPQVASFQKSFQLPLQNIEEFAWLLEYEEYSVTVYPILIDEGMLFASYENDSLFYDGFAIKRIDGLANEQVPLFFDNTHQVKSGPRRFINSDGLVVNLNCEVKKAIGAVARQLCFSEDGDEWIFELGFDSEGTLAMIKQTVNKSGSVVILTKK